MDDILKVLNEGGFKPKTNVDEDFPAIKGEYRIDVTALKPWVPKGGDVMEAYMIELRVTETLSGDKADGRKLVRFYRIAGEKFADGKKVPVEPADKQEALKSLINDVFTLEGAPQLNTASTEAFEASFPAIIGSVGYVRAWGYKTKAMVDGDPLKQDWVLKAQKDLRKDAKGGAAQPRTPF